MVRLERDGRDTLIDWPGVLRMASPRARTALLRQLVRSRIDLRETRAAVWTSVLGPVLASVIFLSIAAPMLPGSEGFAAAHYQ